MCSRQWVSYYREWPGNALSQNLCDKTNNPVNMQFLLTLAVQIRLVLLSLIQELIYEPELASLIANKDAFSRIIYCFIFQH